MDSEKEKPIPAAEEVRDEIPEPAFAPAPAEEDDEDKEERRAFSKVTVAAWTEVKELLELGKIDYTDAAKKLAISRQALHKRVKKEGIEKGSRVAELGKAVKAATIEKAKTFEEKRQDRIEAELENAYKVSKNSQILFARALDAGMKLNPAQPILGLAATKDAMKAIAIAQQGISRATKDILTVLRADEEMRTQAERSFRHIDFDPDIHLKMPVDDMAGLEETVEKIIKDMEKSAGVVTVGEDD